jgi:hypothetical protein
MPATPTHDGKNHTIEITPACLASRQAKKVVLIAFLAKLHGWSRKNSLTLPENHYQ